MSLITSHELAMQLLQALKIPAGTVLSMQLDPQPGKPAKVILSRGVTSAESAEIARTVSRYGLVLQADPPPEAPTHAG